MVELAVHTLISLGASTHHWAGGTDEKADPDHDQNLRNLLDLCRARNIQLNKEKFHLKCSEVSLIGHVMTSNGIKADPKKVESIIKME